ncbi:MAG TPA: PorP/SprF family type IX secretion system membrane protein [Luteibaculaceae bacterium]|nr:PorP/SprF family type IX secretion system membrane protein [Luteibaculaceae bacterium]
MSRWIIIGLVTAISLVRAALGQDLHFSQFATTPSYINPAFTGKFNGEGRFIVNQRQQWRSVTVPYNSFAVAADFSQIKSAPNVGAGMSVYYDRAGDSKLSTLKSDFALSYTLNLSYNRKHSVVFGLQGGLKNIRIDYSALQFDNQYNGTAYDPSLSARENFATDQLISATASSGFTYFWSSSSHVLAAGVGIYNLLASNTTFFETGNSPLDRRYTFQISSEIAAGKYLVFQPACFYGFQNTLHEWLAGSKTKYVLLDDNRYYRAVSAGFFYRNRDAAIATVNFEVNDYNLGFSYDFNTSGLRKASNIRGAIELSLVYIYSSKRAGSRKFSSCPIFI